jgi:putative flavoprotein involved in K+ transport
MRRTDVLIVGAGQAGLAMSACLAARSIGHALIERGRVAERWRSERWDALRLLTPNWMTRLPGHAYAGPDPKGFMSAREVADLLEAYAGAIATPVETGTRVDGLRAAPGGFRIDTDHGPWTARAVVIATGACDRPALPAWAGALPARIHQVATPAYRNPGALPPGGVLVVGASATGVQLAREIRASGREVTLAVGRHTRMLRRYRGRDIMEWLDATGILTEPAARVTDLAAARAQPSMQLSGQPGGPDPHLAALAAEGVRVTGRALGADGARLRLRPDLAEQCAASDARLARVLARIDAHAGAPGAEAPADPDAWRAPDHPACQRTVLDLDAEGIRTVIWATGFRRDYRWLHLPVLDAAGELRHQGGVTAEPGLYVLGLRFLRHRSSNFIDGVGRDAEALASHIATHLAARRPLAA